MTISAVLFDLDGTLLDTAPDFETAVNRLLSTEQCSALKTDAIREHIGDGSAGIIASVFGLERQDPEFPRLQQQLLQNYRECLTDKTAIFNRLDSSLELLDQKDVPWGIVTNKPSEYANPIVRKLLPNCQVLVCPDHVSLPKPDPAGILLGCEKLGIPPSECIYVGDHIRDIQAGQAAKTRTIAVGWGYINPSDQPGNWGANWHVNAPADLSPLLETLLSE